MSLPRSIRPYHFQADLIWWDGPFKLWIAWRLPPAAQPGQIVSWRSSHTHMNLVGPSESCLLSCSAYEADSPSFAYLLFIHCFPEFCGAKEVHCHRLKYRAGTHLAVVPSFALGMPSTSVCILCIFGGQLLLVVRLRLSMFFAVTCGVVRLG